jgi:hypothetical protein
MPTTPRIPSVRTRLQQRETSKSKSPATNSPSGSVGSVSPPRVGIYGPILRGRHTKSLQASILRTREHSLSKTASGCGADDDHDQNNRDFDDFDAKLVSSVVCGAKYRLSYVSAILIYHFIPGAISLLHNRREHPRKSNLSFWKKRRQHPDNTTTSPTHHSTTMSLPRGVAPLHRTQPTDLTTVPGRACSRG